MPVKKILRKTLKPILFTLGGLEKVKKEYQKLQSERPEAISNLQKSRELGDLSENGFYKASRAKLSSLDNRLFQLEMMIKLAVVKTTRIGIISVGSKVTITDGENKRTLQIVGNYEADPLNNKVTTRSPFGKALIGRKENDNIVVYTPKGNKNYRILEVN